MLVVLIHKQQCRSADICVRGGTDYEEANDDQGHKTLLGQHNGREDAKAGSRCERVNNARCDRDKSTGKTGASCALRDRYRGRWVKQVFLSL